MIESGSLFEPFKFGISENGQYKMVRLCFNGFSWRFGKSHIAFHRFMKLLHAPPFFVVRVNLVIR